MTVGQKVRRTGGKMRDGQLGTLVEHEGSIGVKLDRRDNTILPYSEQEWSAVERVPIPLMHLGRITYEADKALRIARGEYGAKEWPSMPEPNRIAWAQGGPPKSDEERCRLYAAIKGALE